MIIQIELCCYLLQQRHGLESVEDMKDFVATKLRGLKAQKAALSHRMCIMFESTLFSKYTKVYTHHKNKTNFKFCLPKLIYLL